LSSQFKVKSVFLIVIVVQSKQVFPILYLLARPKAIVHPKNVLNRCSKRLPHFALCLLRDPNMEPELAHLEHGPSPLASRCCSSPPLPWLRSATAPLRPPPRRLVRVGEEWQRWSKAEGRGKVGPWPRWGRVAAAEQYRAHPSVHSSVTEGLQSTGKATRGNMLDGRRGRAPRRARLPPPPATACDFAATQEKGKESSGSSPHAWSSSPRSSHRRGRKWGENWVDDWRARKNGSHLRLLCALQNLI
jgi:hypothetical protein